MAVSTFQLPVSLPTGKEGHQAMAQQSVTPQSAQANIFQPVANTMAYIGQIAHQYTDRMLNIEQIKDERQRQDELMEAEKDWQTLTSSKNILLEDINNAMKMVEPTSDAYRNLQTLRTQLATEKDWATFMKIAELFNVYHREADSAMQQKLDADSAAKATEIINDSGYNISDFSGKEILTIGRTGTIPDELKKDKPNLKDLQFQQQIKQTEASIAATPTPQEAKKQKELAADLADAELENLNARTDLTTTQTENLKAEINAASNAISGVDSAGKGLTPNQRVISLEKYLDRLREDFAPQEKIDIITNVINEIILDPQARETLKQADFKSRYKRMPNEKLGERLKKLGGDLNFTFLGQTFEIDGKKYNLKDRSQKDKLIDTFFDKLYKLSGEQSNLQSLPVNNLQEGSLNPQ